MYDTLERERLVNNLIDMMFKLDERVRRLEELLLKPGAFGVVVPEPATGGKWQLEVEDIGGDVGPVLVMAEL